MKYKNLEELEKAYSGKNHYGADNILWLKPLDALGYIEDAGESEINILAYIKWEKDNEGEFSWSENCTEIDDFNGNSTAYIRCIREEISQLDNEEFLIEFSTR